MKAVVISDQSHLELVQIPCPTIGDGDLLVRVAYAAVNAADLRRAPQHLTHSAGEPRANVAGLEMSGLVIEKGSKVKGFQVGDRVMGMTSGTYAELCAIDHRHAIRLPDAMSLQAGAASIIAFMTAHDALTSNGELQNGDVVLIQAASSGVGMAAIQVAKYLGARMVIGTTRNHERTADLMALGLDHAIDAVREEVAARVQALAGGGADVVVDMVGGKALQVNVSAAALRGRIVCVGRLAGSCSDLNLDDVARKRLKIIGVTFRTRTAEEHASVVERMIADLGNALGDGSLRSIIDREFELQDAATAQEYLRSGKHFGKILLKVQDQAGDQCQKRS